MGSFDLQFHGFPYGQPSMAVALVAKRMLATCGRRSAQASWRRTISRSGWMVRSASHVTTTKGTCNFHGKCSLGWGGKPMRASAQPMLGSHAEAKRPPGLHFTCGTSHCRPWTSPLHQHIPLLGTPPSYLAKHGQRNESMKIKAGGLTRPTTTWELAKRNGEDHVSDIGPAVTKRIREN